MLSDSRLSYTRQLLVVVDPTSRLRSVVFFGEQKQLDLVDGVITDLPLDSDFTSSIQQNRRLVWAKKKKLLTLGFKDFFKDPKKASLKAFKKKYKKMKRMTDVPIQGSHSSKLLIDSKEFWTSEIKKFAYKIVEDPLPSDMRFREDILWLKKGDFDQSQKWKLKTEAVMRSERKNREDMNKQRLKA